MIGERFTKEARQAVLAAVEEARSESAPKIGRPHMLLALLGSPALAGFDLSREDVEGALREARRKGGLSEADALALRELGIDLDQVVESVEQSLGEGALASMKTRRKRWPFGEHLPFEVELKKTLERSLFEARDLGHDYLGNEHLVLALLAGGGLVTEVLEARGVNYAEVRKRVATGA
ncbi:Clp protease N-terminal domain-containing protein [Umezawaea sp. Da 62-37]|uniref:Clp protease N-terminal domain-containing protein n=1 Tax=Umezawaea sp. Da 62-37 TaxID=3075927 RepID=UPI0028F71808|nr:Clp protease N-terminal domain-containing protein [Umezawaea sp. Da 62-37]WNV91108.1 Clp protease N-terminal domain-containing protein [Umezawaea sp. Da 62-37]